MSEGEQVTAREVEEINNGENLTKTLAYADSLLNGTQAFVKLSKDDETHDPEERFSGPLVDFNQALSVNDRVKAIDWIAKRLGTQPDNAHISHRYLSGDGLTRIARFAQPLGPENDRRFLSYVITEGEKMSFVLWPEEMYDMQVEESGYSLIEAQE